MIEPHVYFRYEFRTQFEAEAWVRWLGLLTGGTVTVEPCPEIEQGGPGWVVLVAERVRPMRKDRGHGS